MYYYGVNLAELAVKKSLKKNKGKTFLKMLNESHRNLKKMGKATIYMSYAELHKAISNLLLKGEIRHFRHVYFDV